MALITGSKQKTVSQEQTSIFALNSMDTFATTSKEYVTKTKSGSVDTPYALIITASLMSVLVCGLVIALIWYHYSKREKTEPSHRDLPAMTTSQAINASKHTKMFSHDSPKYPQFLDRHNDMSPHSARACITGHGKHTQQAREHATPHSCGHQASGTGVGHHTAGSTSELSKKMHMLTRTISNRLLPAVEKIPPVHELVHPILQQPVLEQQREDTASMQDDTCGSAMFGNGKLCFAVAYIEKVEMLHVNVQRAIHLPLHSARKFVNPYVKVKIVPPGTIKYTTRFHKHTPNPYFQESFVFRIPAEDINERVLRMTVYDHCRVASDLSIGHVNFHLRDIRRLPGSHAREAIWREIEADDTKRSYRGELLLTMSYDHDQHRFSMGVIEGRKIQLGDGSTPIAGVYTKVSILVAEQVWKSKRTKTDKSHPGDPVFNEDFCMKVTPTDISHVNVMVAVYGKTSFSHCELIGRTSIGNYSYTSGQGLEHWIEMMTSPKTPTPMWHILT